MTRPWLHDLVMLARLTRDFPGFIRTPITSEQAVEIIQGRLAARGERFLRMAERAIYGHQRSPYHQLLRAAGCEFGDLKALVDKEGLEAALSRLVEAGVFVTFDEFKGRKEAVRGSQRFVFAEDDFDNTRISPHFELRSGGTRGPGTVVKRGLASITDLAVTTRFALHAHGLSEHDHAIWTLAGLPRWTPQNRPYVDRSKPAGSWGGRCLSMGDYVTGTGGTRGAGGAGGRSC